MKIEPVKSGPRSARPTLSYDVVAHYQRKRLALATAQVVQQRGLSATTVAHITSQASAARNTFYKHFENKEACIAWACDEIRPVLFDPVEAAKTGEGPTAQVLDLAFKSLLETTAANPGLSELFFVHSAAVKEIPISGRDTSISILASLFVRASNPSQTQSSELGVRAELIAGGVISLIAANLMQGEAERLPSLRTELVALTVGSLFVPTEVEAALEVPV